MSSAAGGKRGVSLDDKFEFDVVVITFVETAVGGIVIERPGLVLEMIGVPIAERKIEGKKLRTNGVSFARDEIETGEGFAPETPCLRTRNPLVWEEADAAPDAGAKPEVR